MARMRATATRICGRVFMIWLGVRQGPRWAVRAKSGRHLNSWRIGVDPGPGNRAKPECAYSGLTASNNWTVISPAIDGNDLFFA